MTKNFHFKFQNFLTVNTQILKNCALKPLNSTLPKSFHIIVNSQFHFWILYSQSETEEKLATMKTAISEEKQSNKLCQNEVDNLKLIIENQKRTKEKWKEAIIEMTKMLEQKVKELLRENHQLKSRRSV